MIKINNKKRNFIHMKKFPEVNWSGLVRQCITERANQLALREGLLSELGKEKDFIDWSVDLGKKAKKGRFERIK